MVQQQMIIQKMPRHFLNFLTCIIIIFIFSCDSKNEYAGLYRTEKSVDKMESEIELKDNGEGYWRVGDNEETFSWHPKGNSIRLNTRKGGVIVANIRGEVLEITLPGGKRLSLAKME